MAENATPQNEQQIRERAYANYLARQDQEGDEVSDWLAAERELQGQGKKARAAAVSL
jgi:predicted transcriptional regulator